MSDSKDCGTWGASKNCFQGAPLVFAVQFRTQRATAIFRFALVSTCTAISLLTTLCHKVSKRVNEGAGLPDPRHDRGPGGMGGAEEGFGVADDGGAAAGDGGEDDQGKIAVVRDKLAAEKWVPYEFF